MTGSSHASAGMAGFEPFELAVALSHYDTGVITEIRAIKRGSGDAPKALLRTSRGTLLFKRRGPSRGGREQLERVAFSHQLQLHLAARGYPLPRLLGTRDENNSILHLGERLYELFEYVAGEAYSGSESETRSAGRALAILHRLTADFCPQTTPAMRGFHANTATMKRLTAARERLDESGDAPGAEAAKRLTELYEGARDRVEALGYAGWPSQVVHGDWHPGNVVFQSGRVSAALDYDTAHLDARIADVASGTLQFSLHRGDDDLGTWRAEPEIDRLRWFMHGYDGVDGCRLSDREIQAAPWLMIESLVAEAAGPVAETGMFGRHAGGAFLAMIERKARWLHEHHDRIEGWVESPSR